MHIVGTAGHVDHGKSSLVRALTGIDPDRLLEEKRREMTIDLGFAWLRLGEDEVGVVDVPGHRDFIENMLAGVGGIDVALLVVAADEGIMPQTREHLAILDLLQIPLGMVALTRVDLVTDPDLLELVTLETSEALCGTILEEAPIVPVSSRTGEGLETVRNTLRELIQSSHLPRDLDEPRLIIDRVFSLTGHGTIVTGTLLDGPLRVGDSVEIQPGGHSCRIRSLQTHKTKRDVALPGSRVAANLTGINREAIRRGMIVARPGRFRSTRLIDTEYRHLADDPRALTHNLEVKLFVGAAEVSAHARIIGQEQIMPGQSGWVQFALRAPLATARGDRFIVRLPSPGATLGGGRILDPHPGRRHRRFRTATMARFNALAEDSPVELILQTLNRSGVCSVSELIKSAGLSQKDGEGNLARLAQDHHMILIGKEAISVATWREFHERAVALIAEHHRMFPLQLGPDRESIRHRLKLSPTIFSALEESLLRQGNIASKNGLLHLPLHQVEFSADQLNAIARLRELFVHGEVNSPGVKECISIVGADVYGALLSAGEIRQISPDVVYDTTTYSAILRQLITYLDSHASITAAEARDLLGTSRKYAVALVEHLDELRITQRRGDVHERTKLPFDA